MSWLNLEGKTVIVTGGASGIGAAVVDEFLNQGCNVVVSDLSEKETDNEKLLYVKCDVTKRSDVKNVVSKTLETTTSSLPALSIIFATSPSISEIIDVAFGLRASNNSRIRGNP